MSPDLRGPYSRPPHPSRLTLRRRGRTIRAPGLGTLALLALAFAVVCGIAGALVIRVLSRDLPSLEQLETYSPRLITRILGRDGSVLKELYTERRVQVPLDSIAVPVLQAVLATEDRRFYRHWGIDPVGIFRAFAVDIATLSRRQGASTLTQQLARNLYLHRRRTIKRKLREMITAVQIERTYAKDEILQMYFTQMYFGHGAYGVQAAAKLYFGVNAWELDLPRSALLVGLLKAPAHYSPFNHPAAALRRRNTVIENMLRAGFITPAQAVAAQAAPLELAGRETAEDFGTAPYFTEYIRRKLEEMQQPYGFDYYRDGLTVRTTLDTMVQRIAEAAVDSHMAVFQAGFNERFRREGLEDWLVDAWRDSLGLDTLRAELDSLRWTLDSLAAASPEADTLALHARADSLDALFAAREDTAKFHAHRVMTDSAAVESVLTEHFTVQVAFVALDPKNGDILAMIGGRDWGRSKFNRAVQALRQPGSVFKPFVYTTAVDNGIYANYRVLNMVRPIKMEDGTWWRPENYSVNNRGSYVTLREALRRSLNNVTVRLVAGEDRLVPVREVIRYAHRLGIRTPLSPVPSLALGSSGVIPLDIVTAYAVFASGGVRSVPHGLLGIDDKNGVEIFKMDPEREVVLSEETSAIMVDLLQDVINRGTGGSARWKWKFYAPAAGKTGTTNNFTDAWFVGFTPYIVAGVWVGFDDPAISLGPHQSGAVAALPIWAIFMRELYKAKGWDYAEFELPVGVVKVPICAESGELAGPYCPVVVEEVFRRGDEPLVPCHIHRVGSGG